MRCPPNSLMKFPICISALWTHIKPIISPFGAISRWRKACNSALWDHINWLKFIINWASSFFFGMKASFFFYWSTYFRNIEHLKGSKFKHKHGGNDFFGDEFIFHFVKKKFRKRIIYHKFLFWKKEKLPCWKTKFEEKSPRIATIACNMIHLFY